MLLLRRKTPRKLFRTIGVEMDFKSTCVLYWYQSLRFESACPDFRRSGKTGSSAEHSVEWDRCVGRSKGEHDLVDSGLFPGRIGFIVDVRLQRYTLTEPCFWLHMPALARLLVSVYRFVLLRVMLRKGHRESQESGVRAMESAELTDEGSAFRPAVAKSGNTRESETTIMSAETSSASKPAGSVPSSSNASAKPDDDLEKLLSREASAFQREVEVDRILKAFKLK